VRSRAAAATRAAEPLQLRLFDDLPPAPAAARPAGGGRSAALAAPAASGDPLHLRRRLDAMLDGGLRSLVLTENRSRILSARPAGDDDPQGLHLRLDRCFVAAPEAVLREVAAFCQATSRGRRGAARRRQALAAIRRHFDTHGGPARPAPAARSSVLAPRGRHFDLARIRDRVNAEWFEGRLTAAVTWGRERSSRKGARAAWGCRRRRSTLQLGSYSHDDDLIRIHPALDRPGVPEYVVEAVVYHELLHADLPPLVVNGRRRLHTADFRRRERQFPDHARAERWIEANLRKLLKN
jgi:hypothetical protein